ncbi:hypothetical protein CFOL_v3_02460 [Cephalotus follicularis]|uniref:Uncharacterized protein n=1 Tax=Cephalotus follicularis TaxID=3775 RepID=A0A1Q3AT55_CEPFO|nr:hypothetical protein CFOL_v3_02460 [Cephalotus follicularis]
MRHKLFKRKESQKRGSPIPNFNNFAPLLETRTRILAVEKERVTIQWAAPLRSPADKRDSNKYCRYHRDYGHDTEECRHLKNHIEDLIRKGHIRKYVDRDAPQGRREPEQQPRGVIHTISGGVASGGDHSRGRKANARQTFSVQQQHKHGKRLKIGGEEEVISFSEVYLEGVRLPHDDLVVVTLQVDLFTIKRILLDTLCQIQVQMTFLVVDTPSPYNAIIGRPNLNMMEVIVSTRHLVVKFLTRFGIGQVKGDQQVTRQC